MVVYINIIQRLKNSCGHILVPFFLMLLFSCSQQQDEKRSVNIKDSDWLQQSIVYELYIPAFSPSGDYRGVSDYMVRMTQLGINSVVLIQQDSVSQMLLQEGGDQYRKELKSLIDSLHKREIKVLHNFSVADLNPNMSDELLENLNLDGIVISLDADDDAILSMLDSLDLVVIKDADIPVEGSDAHLDNRFPFLIREVLNGDASVDGLFEHFSSLDALNQPIIRFSENHVSNIESNVFDNFGRHAELAMVTSWVLADIPLIYNGQEVGNANNLYENKISWGDHPFNSLLSRLNKLRNDIGPVKTSKLIPNSTELLIYHQEGSERSMISIINLSGSTAAIKAGSVGLEGSFGRFKARDKMTYIPDDTITLAAKSFEILVSR